MLSRGRLAEYQIVWLALLMCGGWLGGCETLQELALQADKPTARVQGVQLQDLDLEGVTLGFEVKISNPYAVAIPLLNLDYTVAQKGNTLVTGNAALSGSIPARGSKVVTLPAQLRFADVLSTLSGLKPGAVVPYSAKLDLGLDVPQLGEMVLPLKTNGEFPIPAVPSVALESVDWESLTLTKASAVLNLRIGNTNSFPFDLASFDYGLALGGKEVIQSSVRQKKSFKAGADDLLRIPIAIKPIDMGIAAFNMLRGSGSGYELGGSMTLDTPFGKMDLPIAATGRTVFKN